jgi:predicted GNAT superfamily acetyltransferase
VVAHKVLANGAGLSLFMRALSHAAEIGIPTLACEFDVDPPNPVSERFHAKFGFHEVSQQFVANGSKLVSLRYAVSGASEGPEFTVET